MLLSKHLRSGLNLVSLAPLFIALRFLLKEGVQLFAPTIGFPSFYHFIPFSPPIDVGTSILPAGAVLSLSAPFHHHFRCTMQVGPRFPFKTRNDPTVRHSLAPLFLLSLKFEVPETFSSPYPQDHPSLMVSSFLLPPPPPLPSILRLK